MTDKGIFTVAKLCKRLETANITNCSFTKKMTSYLKVKRGLRWNFKNNFLFSNPTKQAEEHPEQPSSEELTEFRDIRQESDLSLVFLSNKDMYHDKTNNI